MLISKKKSTHLATILYEDIVLSACSFFFSM